MLQLFALLLSIGILVSAQDWNITNPNWQFQSAWYPGTYDPTWSGSCCLPTSLNLNVTSNISGVQFTLNYVNTPACGKVAGGQELVNTSPFEGVSSSGKGGHSVRVYVTYWPHNQTLFLQPGACVWMYTIPQVSVTTWDKNYFMPGPWNLMTLWGTYTTDTCCLPQQSQFMVSQNTINSAASFQFNWDFNNSWCLLFWPWESNVFTAPTTAGGGMNFGNLTLAYYPLNSTMGLFFDSCAYYFTRGCAPGNWWSNPNQACVPCSNSCATCVTYAQCTTCPPGFLLLLGSCFQCQEGDILNAQCANFLQTGSLSPTGRLIAIIVPTVIGGLLILVLILVCYKYRSKLNSFIFKTNVCIGNKAKKYQNSQQKDDRPGVHLAQSAGYSAVSSQPRSPTDAYQAGSPEPISVRT